MQGVSPTSGVGAVPKRRVDSMRARVPKRLAGSMTACKLTGPTDTPSPLSRRQTVTSRAVVRIEWASLFLRNHKFSEGPHAWRLCCRDDWRVT